MRMSDPLEMTIRERHRRSRLADAVSDGQACRDREASRRMLIAEVQWYTRKGMNMTALEQVSN